MDKNQKAKMNRVNEAAKAILMLQKQQAEIANQLKKHKAILEADYEEGMQIEGARIYYRSSPPSLTYEKKLKELEFKNFVSNLPYLYRTSLPNVEKIYEILSIDVSRISAYDLELRQKIQENFKTYGVKIKQVQKRLVIQAESQGEWYGRETEDQDLPF